jgi:hypothetical protein
MLNTPILDTKKIAEDREARIQELLAQLRAAAEPTFRQLAEQLTDAPDAQLFGPLEYAVREHGLTLAAAAQQAGLDGRKKRGT